MSKQNILYILDISRYNVTQYGTEYEHFKSSNAYLQPDFDLTNDTHSSP